MMVLFNVLIDRTLQIILKKGKYYPSLKRERSKGKKIFYPGGSGSGRSHVVLFSTWSTKYSLPFGSTLCSHLDNKMTVKKLRTRWWSTAPTIYLWISNSFDSMSHPAMKAANRQWRSQRQPYMSCNYSSDNGASQAQSQKNVKCHKWQSHRSNQCSETPLLLSTV